MFNRVHHLTFVVADLDSAVAQWQRNSGADTGAIVREALPERGVISARWRAGDLWIVLVQPVADGAVATHFHEHGEGLMIISFAVPSIAAALAELAARGVRASGVPRIGAGDWCVVDLATTLIIGVITQVCEVPASRAPRGGH